MRFIDRFHDDFGQDKDPNTGYPFKDCPADHGYEPDKYACDEMPDCVTCWMREASEACDG